MTGGLDFLSGAGPARRHRWRAAVIIALGLIASATIGGTTAAAGELVYRPVNPAFGGNPLNGTFLFNTAQAQNIEEDDAGTGRASALEQFTETLQRRLLGDVAREVSSLILGPEARDSGEIAIQDTLITFERIGDQVALSIVDQLTGETTQISLPVVN